MPVRISYSVLGQIPAAARARLSAVVHATAARIEARAKEQAPVDTGNLRNSIQHRQTGPMEAEVAAHAEYAAAVEFGTGVFSTDPDADKQPIVIEPKEKRALYWPGARHPVRRVVQQGQPPRPYLVPAAEEARDQFVRDCAAAIEAAARDAGGSQL